MKSLLKASSPMASVVAALVKKILSPWVLVLTGILLNIFSAVITNHFINKNNDELSQLDAKSEHIDKQINAYWQDKQVLERKMEFILLLIQQSYFQAERFPDTPLAIKPSDENRTKPFIENYIQAYLEQLASEHEIPWNNEITFDSEKVVLLINNAQTEIINDIDDIYFDKLTFEKQKQQLNQTNGHLMSIALFMQMLGLILVLARDLQRKP